MSRGYIKGLHTDISKGTSSKGITRGRNMPLPERAALSLNRVIQRDLIYVIGIPLEIANEETLNRYEYFGQYGPIKKIVVNQTVHTNTYQKPTVSAYITFVNVEDAWECLYALESFSINGHQIKASFGTSKYCSSFLCGQKCSKPDCMYLHYIGKEEDSFSTEEIQQNSARFVKMTRPQRPPDYDNYGFFDSKPTIFPPKRNINERLDNDYDYYDMEEEEIVEDTQNMNHNFLGKLAYRGYLTTTPLNVNYTAGQSLNEQLGLSRPSIRSALKHDITSLSNV